LLIYENPILEADYSDPDVIRVGEDFYMVSSSFNYVPSIPIMHSKDLVHWEIINYVSFSLMPSFKKVRSGEGVWAPSIRYHNGTFYVMAPFPDEGLYVSSSDDIYGKWSDFSLLLEGKGFEDPCPIWENGRTYVVFAFVKSRIGFNSKLGLIETDERLSKVISSEYKIIYDGTKDDPTIEGPKCYHHLGKTFILCPAGGVEHGYQVALRADSIFGPFERKVILSEGNNGINGPHQGALIDINDNDEYAFIHFRDQKELGRITYLENVVFEDNWPICGKDGKPQKDGLINLEECELNIDYSSSFSSLKLDKIFQTPALVDDKWLECSTSGLRMNCRVNSFNNLSLFPYVLAEKISGYKMQATLEVEPHLKENERVLFGIFGCDYIFIGYKMVNNELYYVTSLKPKDGIEEERIFKKVNYLEPLYVTYEYPDSCSIIIGPLVISSCLHKEHWTGLHIGITCFNNVQSDGYVVLKSLKVTYDK